jgi:hypothetical protein
MNSLKDWGVIISGNLGFADAFMYIMNIWIFRELDAEAYTNPRGVINAQYRSVYKTQPTLNKVKCSSPLVR